jgi:hypothetical protein
MTRALSPESFELVRPRHIKGERAFSSFALGRPDDISADLQSTQPLVEQLAPPVGDFRLDAECACEMNDEPTRHTACKPRIGRCADEVDAHGGNLTVGHTQQSLNEGAHSPCRMDGVPWTGFDGVEPGPSRTNRPDHNACVKGLPIQPVRLRDDLQAADDGHRGAHAPTVQIAGQQMDIVEIGMGPLIPSEDRDRLRAYGHRNQQHEDETRKDPHDNTPSAYDAPASESFQNGRLRLPRTNAGEKQSPTG